MAQLTTGRSSQFAALGHRVALLSLFPALPAGFTPAPFARFSLEHTSETDAPASLSRAISFGAVTVALETLAFSPADLAREIAFGSTSIDLGGVAADPAGLSRVSSIGPVTFVQQTVQLAAPAPIARVVVLGASPNIWNHYTHPAIALRVAGRRTASLSVVTQSPITLRIAGKTT